MEIPFIQPEAWVLVGLFFFIGLALGWHGRGGGRAARARAEAERDTTVAARADADANRIRLERDLAAARDQVKPLADEVDRLRRDAARAERAALAAAPPAPAELDDLRILKGVGDKLADRLAALGITTVPAMAALDNGEAARADAELGPFTGRIARDQLVDQARLLADGRVTEYEARYGRIERGDVL